jgi:hypothetical protein
MGDALSKLERELKLADRAETQSSLIEVLNIYAVLASPAHLPDIARFAEDIAGIERTRGRQRAVSSRLAAALAAVRTK